MGFYPPDALAHEAQRRGIVVLPPCVLASEVECSVEPVAGGSLAVRIGLGYVGDVRADDVAEIVAERRRGGPFASVEDLAARCGTRSEGLGLLAYAGACDALAGGRRQALWLLGVAVPGVRGSHGTQLALPLEGESPALAEMSPWELLLADYGATRITLADHPLELLRPGLGDDVRSSRELERASHGTRVRVAGLVVARQRPATARGVTFMLLEDEHGSINLVVPPPVHDSCRLAVRAEPFVVAEGTLERREGVTNVVVRAVHRLERGDLPAAEVRHIEPERAWSSDDAADLRAVAPAAQSFGGRGR